MDFLSNPPKQELYKRYPFYTMHIVYCIKNIPQQSLVSELYRKVFKCEKFR